MNYFSFQNLRHDAVVAPLPGTRRKNDSDRQFRGNLRRRNPANPKPSVPPPPTVFDPLTALGQHLVNSMVPVGAPIHQGATSATRNVSAEVKPSNIAEPSKNGPTVSESINKEVNNKETEVSPQGAVTTAAETTVSSILSTAIFPTSQHEVPSAGVRKGQYSEQEVQRRIDAANNSAEVVKIVSGFKQHSRNITTTSSGKYSTVCSATLCGVYCTAIERILLLRRKSFTTGSSSNRRQSWMLLSAEARSSMNEWVSALHSVILQNPLQLDAAAVALVMRGATAIGLRDMKLYRAIMRELESRSGKLDISRWTLLLASLVEALHLQALHTEDEHLSLIKKIKSSSDMGLGSVGNASSTAPWSSVNKNIGNAPLSVRARGLRPHYNLSMNRVSASSVPAVSGRYRQTEATSALGMSSGLARMGVSITKAETTFMKFASAEILAKEMEIAALSPKTIASLLVSLSALGHKNLQVLAALGKSALRKQNQFEADDWSSCLNVFIRFGVPLRDNCIMSKRPSFVRDWMIPPNPKRPVPMSQC
eukprot:Lankesteria_metandrocarpae@DN988_c0_g1_i1.p1